MPRSKYYQCNSGARRSYRRSLRRRYGNGSLLCWGGQCFYIKQQYALDSSIQIFCYLIGPALSSYGLVLDAVFESNKEEKRSDCKCVPPSFIGETPFTKTAFSSRTINFLVCLARTGGFWKSLVKGPQNEGRFEEGNKGPDGASKGPETDAVMQVEALLLQV